MYYRILWDELRASLWFRTALWVAGAGLLALFLVALDRQLIAQDIHLRLPWLFLAGLSGASTMLGAIGSAMLTVATLTFSIIMVAVVQTANAYSPRLLRHYFADSHNQHVLGILLGTWLYSLLILRVVTADNDTAFVPSLSISVGLLLALLSVVAFIYFIHHVAHSIEVSSLITNIYKEAEPLLDSLFPNAVGLPWQGDRPPPDPVGHSSTVYALQAGYIEFVAGNTLLRAAQEANACIRLERMIGEFTLPGAPLATVWPAEALDDALAHVIHQSIIVDKERTMVQDLHFGVQRLVDVALRAVSPSVNDPTTAINCIDILAVLLAQAAQRGFLVSPYRCDEGGNVRLIARAPTFESMIDFSFNQIRYYMRGDLLTALRLLEVCADLAHITADPSEQAALWKHVRMVARNSDRFVQEPCDRAAINERLHLAAKILGRNPSELLLGAASEEASRYLSC